jgi:hypothetical protein
MSRAAKILAAWGSATGLDVPYLRCGRTENKGNSGDHGIGPFQPVKDDGDHAIGYAQWMTALGKFVMRNVLLQLKDRGGGHLILLVGETFLVKISYLLQHTLQYSRKLPLHFHLAFGTEHIHVITLTFVFRDFTFPRQKHCAN